MTMQPTLLPPHCAALPFAPSLDDRRQDRRHATVLLVGRVRGDSGESACLVHDISASGLMARFTTPPVVDDVLLIEVRGLPEVRATVRWVNGFKAGCAFDAPQDLTRVFCLRDESGLVMRTPRFAMRAASSVRIGERRFAVDILDISPGGVKLAAEETVQVGQAGSILLPAIKALCFGVVCWTRGDRFGFRFSTPLPLTSLSQVLDGS
ncbi:PilZ domain-containing protein [Sphingomonas sp. MA1305]|uniref:PilZ domain-containing protein n=1 Tax=Sphingomonas sp. MA1305 TaxID=2479204 RepID=UPI0018DF6E8E|nr:PilZ domain-containing protein [Sphingomonas sp. MA1305]MBI0475857.1 PilZ domain-containing protein [Sphingomonas sp. MA1305]